VARSDADVGFDLLCMAVVHGSSPDQTEFCGFCFWLKISFRKLPEISFCNYDCFGLRVTCCCNDCS